MSIFSITLIILAHFVVFSLPPLVGSFFDRQNQITLNYTYIGVLFAIVQLFDSLYSIPITSDFSLFGGDIAYSAVLFSSLYLVFTQPDPKVVRNLIYVSIVNTTFLFLLFGVIRENISNNQLTIYLNVGEVFLEFSVLSLLLSFFLFATEMLLTLIIMNNIPAPFKKNTLFPHILAVIYVIVLMIDGILYPIFMNLLFDLNLSLLNSLVAKLIFGIGFGGILVFLLFLRPGNLLDFVENKKKIRYYLIPPKESDLLDQLEQAEKRIEALEGFLPICSSCKKIRDQKGEWKKLESYLLEHKDIEFTHGYCQDCSDRIFKEME